MTHSAIAKKVEDVLTDPTAIAKVSVDSVDACYSPIIQSGGKYDIKVSAFSDDEVLSPDVIICSLGSVELHSFVVVIPAQADRSD